MRSSKVIRAVSKPSLLRAWNLSRDNSADAGGPGVDGVTALQFGARLDANLSSLAKSIRMGQYAPSSLRGVLIPKANGQDKRLISIPTIKDRIVQRALVQHLTTERTRLPIFNPVSFGSLKQRGVSAALARATSLRSKYDWCLKTDIESFFDTIPRNDLKDRLDKALVNDAALPLLKRFIDCEIKEERHLRALLVSRKIRRGVGLRQGMPLSPLLANVALADFDADVEKAGMPMIRYVDDILIFCRSKVAAQDALKFIRERLNVRGFSIPELAEQSKTKLYSPKEHVDFLGRELFFHEPSQQYLSRVGHKQIQKLGSQLEDQYSLDIRLRSGSTFQETVVDLSRSISA